MSETSMMFDKDIPEWKCLCHLICPTCGWPFHWDGIGSGDECPAPFCKGYARADSCSVTEEQYEIQYNAKIFEMGSEFKITQYDYHHRACGTQVRFDKGPGRWFCPKCHLASNLEALLRKEERETQVMA